MEGQAKQTLYEGCTQPRVDQTRETAAITSRAVIHLAARWSRRPCQAWSGRHLQARCICNRDTSDSWQVSLSLSLKCQLWRQLLVLRNSLQRIDTELNLVKIIHQPLRRKCRPGADKPSPVLVIHLHLCKINHNREPLVVWSRRHTRLASRTTSFASFDTSACAESTKAF